MRDPFAFLGCRVAVAFLALAIAFAGCSNGGGGSLPYAGQPNNGGGSPGTYQSGGTSTALLRFVQGSPDYAAVDVCVDNLPFGVTAPTVAYGTASAQLYAIAGGESHSVSVYSSLGGTSVGQECATAPGPYFGLAAIAVTVIAPGTQNNPARETVVLGGSAATATLGLYVFGEPRFATAPSSEAISQNAAPAFSALAGSVGFGSVALGGVATNLAGAQSVAAPAVSPVRASVVNSSVVSPLGGVPTAFYDGAGSSGSVVPVFTVPAPAQAAGQPYVVELYAIDAAAGGLSLVAVPEQTVGYGF